MRYIAKVRDTNWVTTQKDTVAHCTFHCSSWLYLLVSDSAKNVTDYK